MGTLLFARGRINETALADPVAAGATQVLLDAADTLFAPGDPLFISDDDGAAPEFLGRVKLASPTLLHFSLPAARARSTGALLWKPAASQPVGALNGSPIKRRERTGVVTLRSLGGRVWSIRTAEPSSALTLRLENLTPLREAELLAWLMTEIEAGLQPFTLIAMNRALTAVRLAEPQILRDRTDGDRRRLTLELLVEHDAAYA